MSMTTNFIPSDNLKHYVDAGELSTARSALFMELDDSELDAADLRAAQSWAASRVAGLYEGYAESAFARAVDREEAHWNVEYFDTQMVYLKMNFCQHWTISCQGHARWRYARQPSPCGVTPEIGIASGGARALDCRRRCRCSGVVPDRAGEIGRERSHSECRRIATRP